MRFQRATFGAFARGLGLLGAGLCDSVACRRHASADRLHDSRGIPGGWTSLPSDLATLPVNQERCWDAHRAQCSNVVKRVEIGMQVLQPDLLEERLYGRQAFRVDRDGHDFEARSAQRRLKAIKGGHFLSTGWAPGGPHIEQYHSAA